MKMSKFLTSMLLALCMCLGIVGCVKTPQPSTTTEKPTTHTTSGTSSATTTTTTTTKPTSTHATSTERQPNTTYVDVVRDWGVEQGKGHGKANSLILLEKLYTVADYTDVIFPEGEYELAFPMYIEGKTGVYIVGENAKLIRTGATNNAAQQSAMTDADIPYQVRDLTKSSGFFVINKSEHIGIDGFSFTYDIPTSLSGKVLSKDGGTIVVEITNTTHFTGDEYITVLNTFTAAGAPDRTLEQYATSHFPAEKLSDTTLRVTGLSEGGVSNLSIGTRVCLRLSTSSDYIVEVSATKDIAFTNLTMHSSLNGGIIVGSRCEDITLKNVTVTPENKESLMSLNADILHISSLLGSLYVEDCHFARSGDDCINVHDMAYVVSGVSGNAASIYAPRFSFSSNWAKAGDVIDFYDDITFDYLGSATITKINGQTFTFDHMPKGVGEGTVITNKTKHPAVTIRNTIIEAIRARGFLLQTENVLVENCTFRDTALAAILLAPDLAKWYEMGPAKNVTIRNNTFENCGRYGASGTIQITANHDSATKTYPAYIHRDITIVGNTFSGTGKAALHGLCIEGLTFSDNDLTAYKGTRYLYLLNCTDVTLDEKAQSKSYLKDVTFAE